MDSGLLIFLGVVLIIAVVVFAAITKNRSFIKRLDREKYQSDWLKIENKFTREDQDSYQWVVLNADKLLGRALEELGVAGSTMGERMKNYKNHFSNLNGVWQAHKLRNKIAHEVDVELTFEQTRSALSRFKQALKDLGAI